MLKPAEFLAPGYAGGAGDFIRPRPAEVQEHVQEMQADGRDEDGGHSDEREGPAVVAAQVDDGAFVAAEKPFDAFQRDGVHVPSVAADVGDVLDER